MPARDLPNDRATLEYLNHSLDRLLAVLVPLCQQVNSVTESAGHMLEGDFTDTDFYAVVFRELQQNVARGIPPHQALSDFLDLNVFINSSQVPELELQRLDHRISSGTASASDRERHAILAAIRIAEYRDAIGAFVDHLHQLQRRIINKFATPTTSSEPAGLAPQPFTGPPSGPALGPDQGATTLQHGLPEQTRAKGADRTGVGVQPSRRCEQWAIGLDETQTWQVFRRFGRKWRYQRPLSTLKKTGREWTFLKGFADSGGVLTRLQLIKLVVQSFSDEEGVRIYINSVKSGLSRLRTRLQRELELDEEDPFPWDDGLEGHRMLIAVGYSVEDDQHRPQFHTREELAT
jgi:hypothetical protein